MALHIIFRFLKIFSACHACRVCAQKQMHLAIVRQNCLVQRKTFQIRRNRSCQIQSGGGTTHELPEEGCVISFLREGATTASIGIIVGAQCVYRWDWL